VESNTELVECKFQTISRRHVFGTDFDPVFHRSGISHWPQSPSG